MSLRTLAGHTLWYGLSNIIGRFLNFFMTSILLAWLYPPADIAAVSQVYVIVPFLNILFTLGLETSYFRFSQQKPKQTLFNTLNSLLILTTGVFTLILLTGFESISNWIDMGRNRHFYLLMVWIVCADTLAAIPFARLRSEGRPQKFAWIKLSNILINIGLVGFWLGVCPWLVNRGVMLPHWLYNPALGPGYLLWANLLASILTLFLLSSAWKGFRWEINKPLLREIMIYSFPIIIVGFGGMINDFLSRQLYYRLLSDPLPVLDHEFGVFIANYKLAVLATLFIQVFRMGAEPFFFNQMGNKDAPETYARVTKWFVIICCLLFLGITLNLDAVVQLIAYRHPAYAEGRHIVPVLTMANILIGIYYNLSVWYKLSNRTWSGAIITLIGVLITIILNVLWVPLWHYTGAAWATFFCYLGMLMITYFWGRRIYPVPYQTKRLTLYLLVVSGCYVSKELLAVSIHGWHPILGGFIAFLICSLGFLLLLWHLEKDEISKLPWIGKYISTRSG